MATENKPHSHSGHRMRMRERFESDGASAFQDHELLEMLLFYALPQRNTNDLAHNLIDEFGSLAGVFDAPLSALENVKGIGKNAAVLIKFIPELYSRYSLSKNLLNNYQLDTTEKMGKYFVSQFAPYKDREVAIVSCLDNQLRVKKTFVISEGNLKKTAIDIKKIISCAVNTNSTSIILAHNHPAGVAAPSGQDVEVMRTVANMLYKLDIKFLDSFIVAGDDYHSMATKGRYKYLFE